VSRSLQLGALGAGMCLFAAAFAAAALYVPGVTLVLVALAAATLVAAAARGARVDLDLSADRVEEGEQVAVTARVSGGIAVACRGTLRVLPGAATSPLDWRRRSAQQSLRSVRRGRAVVGPATAHWADPFGLSARERASEPRELLVLPRVQRLRPRELERIAALPEPVLSPTDGMELDGLREWIPGSPASRIHWLTLARTGTAMERRLRGDQDRRPFTVVLDPRSGASESDLDMAVRAAASLCLALARAGGCSVLVGDQPRIEDLGPGLEAWERLHETLALVTPAAVPRWELVRGARRIVLVHPGQSRTPREVSVSCTVSPSPRPGAEVLFNVAGCAVQTIGRTRERRAA
jgi:uncharacterized protein (DUF58 family)